MLIRFEELTGRLHGFDNTKSAELNHRCVEGPTLNVVVPSKFIKAKKETARAVSMIGRCAGCEPGVKS